MKTVRTDKRANKGASHFIVVVVLILSLAGMVLAQEPVKFQEDVQLVKNGDAQIALHFDMSMMQTQQIRDNVSNLYLTLRELASHRGAAEVVDKSASYDDAKHAVDFTMTMKGAARNFGDDWEYGVEEVLDFSNFDQGQRTFYFSEVTEGFGGAMRGKYSLKLPGTASEMSWDNNRRIVRWKAPGPKQAGGSGLWILAFVMVALGLAATGVSFALKE